MSEAVLYTRGLASRLTDAVRLLCEGPVSAASGGAGQGQWAAMALRPKLADALAAPVARVLARPVVLVVTRSGQVSIALHLPDGRTIGPVDGRDPLATAALADELRAVRGIRSLESGRLAEILDQRSAGSQSDGERVAIALGLQPRRRTQQLSPTEQTGLRLRVADPARLRAAYVRRRRRRRWRTVLVVIGVWAALTAWVESMRPQYDGGVTITVFAVAAVVALVAAVGVGRSMRGIGTTP